MDSTEELIEGIAKYLCDSVDTDDLLWENISELERGDYRDYARHIINLFNHWLEEKGAMQLYSECIGQPVSLVPLRLDTK